MQRRRPVFAHVLIWPVVAWLAIFIVLPTVLLLLYSFCQRDRYGQIVYTLTTENYRQAFDSLYIRVLWRSLVYATITTIGCIAIGYPVAYFIGRSPPRRRDWLMLLIMLPFWTSFVIRTYAWITILGQHGFVNGLLESLHFINAPLAMLYTPGAVVLGLIYTYLPFMILPIYTSVEQLDASLLEAAADLGAGPLRTFWRITLPLTTSGVVAGVILTLVPALGMFAVSSLLGGAREPLVGDVIEQNVIGAGRNLPFGAALSVVLMALFLLMLAIVAIGRRVVRR